MDGYATSSEGKCLSCEELNIHNCKKCVEDKETGNYECKECSEHYYLNGEGVCKECFLISELINDKCIKCGDSSQGGIENCLFCQKNNENNGILCKQCKFGYILYKDKNICLPLNETFSNFETCLELTQKEGKYVCTRCKPEYSLLKEEKEIESKCILLKLYMIQIYMIIYIMVEIVAIISVFMDTILINMEIIFILNKQNIFLVKYQLIQEPKIILHILAKNVMIYLKMKIMISIIIIVIIIFIIIFIFITGIIMKMIYIFRGMMSMKIIILMRFLLSHILIYFR